ncbi:MAG TPA: DUF4403 family protein [Gemmatimonadales bacterium]|nr:DUF4403 family protein [Gemmatimonadales bacterium]
MPRPNRLSRPVPLLAAALLACGRVDAPPPEAAGGMPSVDTMALLPPSHVSAPIVLDLRPILEEIEAGLPRRLGSLEHRFKLEGTPLLVAVQLERRPLRFTFGENSVQVEAVFGYRGKAWLDSPVKPSVSCGTEGPPPRLRIRVATEYSLDSAWTVRTRSRLLDLAPVSDDPRDRCEVSLLSVDVTGKLVDGARTAIEQELRRLDRHLARTSLRPQVEDLWRMLQQPLRISDSIVWLRIDPMAVGLGPIVPRDSGVVARVSLVARPTFVSGPRPPDGDQPLPPLGPHVPGRDTALVLVEGLLTWEGATGILAKELRGKRVRIGWRWVTVDDVAARPLADGRLALEVGLRGLARGRVWLAGRPAYDSTSRMITIPDLELDMRSRRALTGGLLWLADGPLTDWVRDKARIPADTLLEAARHKANEALDRELADGVRLSGRVVAAEPLGVLVTAEGLIARARGVAVLRLDIRQDNLIPQLRARR